MGALLAYRNLADNATLTLNAGTVDPDFPLSNMQTRQLSEIARLNDMGLDTARLDVIIDRGFGAAALPAGIAALLGMNMVASGAQPRAFTVTTSADNVTYSANLVVSGVPGIDAGVAELPASYIAELEGTLLRYIRVYATWPHAIAPAADVSDVGRLWVGPAIKVPYGVEKTWDLDFIDNGSVDESGGFQGYENKESKRRVVSCTFSGSELTAAIAFGVDPTTGSSLGDVASFQGLQMEAGTTGEIILAPRTSQTAWLRRLAVYGRMDAGRRPAVKHVSGGFYSVSLTAIEER